MEEPQWICTDADNQQYGRQLSGTLFEFKELSRDDYSYDKDEFVQFEVDLSKYTDEQKECHINTYGYTLTDKPRYSNIFEEYGEQADWIIAECIFEQESGNY